MAKFIDYYKILGVSKDTPQSEIKAAYRKRSKQFHPDLHPDDPKAKAKFQLLNEAYEVLNDPDKRARYDKYGEQWNKVNNPFENAGGGGGNGGNPFGGFEFNMGGGQFSDFFSELFGGMGGKTRSARGFNPFEGFTSSPQPTPDAQASIDIDIYQALLGGEIILQVASSKLKIKIQPCTQPGTKIRLKGKGNVGLDGKASDLILTLNVKLPQSLSDRQKRLVEELQKGG